MPDNEALCQLSSEYHKYIRHYIYTYYFTYLLLIFIVIHTMLNNNLYVNQAQQENVNGDFSGDGFQNGGTLVVAQGKY